MPSQLPLEPVLDFIQQHLRRLSRRLPDLLGPDRERVPQLPKLFFDHLHPTLSRPLYGMPIDPTQSHQFLLQLLRLGLSDLLRSLSHRVHPMQRNQYDKPQLPNS